MNKEIKELFQIKLKNLIVLFLILGIVALLIILVLTIMGHEITPEESKRNYQSTFTTVTETYSCKTGDYKTTINEQAGFKATFYCFDRQDDFNFVVNTLKNKGSNKSNLEINKLGEVFIEDIKTSKRKKIAQLGGIDEDTNLEYLFYKNKVLIVSSKKYNRYYGQSDALIRILDPRTGSVKIIDKINNFLDLDSVIIYEDQLVIVSYPKIIFYDLISKKKMFSDKIDNHLTGTIAITQLQHKYLLFTDINAKNSILYNLELKKGYEIPNIEKPLVSRDYDPKRLFNPDIKCDFSLSNPRFAGKDNIVVGIYKLSDNQVLRTFGSGFYFPELPMVQRYSCMLNDKSVVLFTLEEIGK